ncbi:hypothetical protein GQ53DRAFT_889304 [Thozetella sp. PMI_491]|nr:hypothetical protein GQ53DRAFT_889304 [Thozetella sp. PMI_491]
MEVVTYIILGSTLVMTGPKRIPMSTPAVSNGQDGKTQPPWFPGNLSVPPPSGPIPVHLVSENTYFIIFSSSFRSMLPFRTLRHYGGVPVAYSLCLSPGGLTGPLTSLTLMWNLRDPLPILTDLATLLSGVLVSLSSEAVGLKVFGSCAPGDFSDCYMGLSTFRGPAVAAEVILVILCVFFVAISVILWKWKSGLSACPRSVVGIASILTHERTIDLARRINPPKRGRHISKSHIAETMRGTTFSLGPFRDKRGREEFGIFASDDGQTSNQKVIASDKRRPAWRCCTGFFDSIDSSRREHIANTLFLVFLCNLLYIILYYENTSMDTPFERFMDNQGFGVRFLFAGIGTAITFFWDYHFSRVAVLTSYRKLSSHPQLAERSVLVSPATNVFSGLWKAIEYRDVYLGAVALAGFVSKFTPILLSNVPYSLTLTWEAHEICTWMVVSVLVYMILVLVVSSFIEWPYLPADPDTLAGRLYYICDSQILETCEGMSTMPDKARRGALARSKLQYSFGEMTGLSGTTRVGIGCSVNNAI